MTTQRNKKSSLVVILDAQRRGSREVKFRTNFQEILDICRSWITALLLFICLIFSTPTFAAQKIQEVNYYASFRAPETNVRAGPGQNYPVKFTYKLKGVPVRVISEYDNWNEVEDYEKQTGWISQSLLTKKRTAMIQTTRDFINMHAKASEKSRVLFHLENFVIADFLGCQDDWCNIKIQGKKGWVKKDNIYGTDD